VAGTALSGTSGDAAGDVYIEVHRSRDGRRRADRLHWPVYDRLPPAADLADDKDVSDQLRQQRLARDCDQQLCSPRQGGSAAVRR